MTLSSVACHATSWLLLAIVASGKASANAPPAAVRVNATKPVPAAFKAKETIPVIRAKDHGSATQSTGTETLQAATTAEGTRDRFSALQRLDAKRPGESGHFLSNRQLDPITSIRCLQEKQEHPYRPCGQPPAKDTFDNRVPLSLGHYPTWRDYDCHSNNEFFCDPEKLLTSSDRFDAQERLRLTKERTLVNCGQMESIMDADAKRRWYEKKHPVYTGRLDLEDYRHFNLAVALADDWPSSELDPQSMEYFGRLIMSRWGLMPIYNGVDNGNGVNQHYSWREYYSSCPNTAILIILPKYHHAFIYAPSCEYVCATRGGPEIIAATLRGLDRGGVKEAIMKGIDAFDKVMKVTKPLSIQPAPVKKMWRGSVSRDIAADDAAWIWTLRVVYVFLIVLFIFIVVSFVYYNFYPKREPESVFRVLAEDTGAQRRAVHYAFTHRV